MDFSDCRLYGIQSKRHLKYLLGIKSSIPTQREIAQKIRPYIENKDGKKRLIEPPDEDIKKIQTKIKKYLFKIAVPENVFSGVRGKSYVDNTRVHINARYLYKLDLSGFFPSVSRDSVYAFFRNDLQCNPDIASVLTNFTTINLDMANVRNPEQISAFLDNKNIDCRNHLISGSPTSQLLSYLVNWRLFSHLFDLSKSNNIIMTIYVDDITFSSPQPIPPTFRISVKTALLVKGYQLSRNKEKLYRPHQCKLVTGVIISPDHRLLCKNRLRRKIILKLDELKQTPSDEHTRQQLRGLVTAARQTQNDEFPSVYSLAFDHLHTIKSK